jgi:hypothetical protein
MEKNFSSYPKGNIENINPLSPPRKFFILSKKYNIKTLRVGGGRRGMRSSP